MSNFFYFYVNQFLFIKKLILVFFRSAYSKSSSKINPKLSSLVFHSFNIQVISNVKPYSLFFYHFNVKINNLKLNLF